MLVVRAGAGARGRVAFGVASSAGGQAARAARFQAHACGSCLSAARQREASSAARLPPEQRKRSRARRADHPVAARPRAPAAARCPLRRGGRPPLRPPEGDAPRLGAAPRRVCSWQWGVVRGRETFWRAWSWRRSVARGRRRSCGLDGRRGAFGSWAMLVVRVGAAARGWVAFGVASSAGGQAARAARFQAHACGSCLSAARQRVASSAARLPPEQRKRSRARRGRPPRRLPPARRSRRSRAPAARAPHPPARRNRRSVPPPSRGATREPGLAARGDAFDRTRLQYISYEMSANRRT